MRLSTILKVVGMLVVAVIVGGVLSSCTQISINIRD